MKYAEDFEILVDVETSAGFRHIAYTPDDLSSLGQGEYVHHGLGYQVKDGRWHSFARDLQADLAAAQPGVILQQVNGISIRGSGRLDDVELSDFMPEDIDGDGLGDSD